MVGSWLLISDCLSQQLIWLNTYVIPFWLTVPWVACLVNLHDPFTCFLTRWTVFFFFTPIWKCWLWWRFCIVFSLNTLIVCSLNLTNIWYVYILLYFCQCCTRFYICYICIIYVNWSTSSYRYFHSAIFPFIITVSLQGLALRVICNQLTTYL